MHNVTQPSHNCFHPNPSGNNTTITQLFPPRVAAVGAWPVPWAPCGRRGGVAGPLGPVWPPWWLGRSPGPYTVFSRSPLEIIELSVASVQQLRSFTTALPPPQEVFVYLLLCPLGFTLAGHPPKCECTPLLHRHSFTESHVIFTPRQYNVQGGNGWDIPVLLLMAVAE